ncbi:MAG: NAD-dependent epimerase/dehydratase family protein [Bacillota bacterium]
METSELNVVTGAFGYTGKHITRRLLSLGKSVKTLTGRPRRTNPFGGRVSAAPFNFDNPRELIRSLCGAETLYNTYWVRFPHGDLTYDKAVENTGILVKAAREAGVCRIVHVSITNASPDSPLPYFRGKGILEEFIAGSGMSYAVIRPTVIFGSEDILINNMAWLLRRFPVFAVPGSGDYRLQPVFVEDMARMAVEAGQAKDNVVMDAAGPEVYTFNELVRLIAETVKSGVKLLHLEPGLAYALSQLIGHIVKDVVLTWDEVKGLMADLLVTTSPPTGYTRLSDWLTRNSATVGKRYASELNRHYR